MFVGFLDRHKKPRTIAKTTALIAANYGLKLIYFTPWDIDIEAKKINGKIFNGVKWVSVRGDIPPLIDVQSICFKRDTRDTVNQLKKYSVFTFDRRNRPNKLQLQNALKKDEEFKRVVIPTKKLKKIDDLYTFLDKHNNIIIKPIAGQQGKDVYSLQKKEDNYLLSYGTVEKELSKQQLNAFYTKILVNNNFILQKLIQSKTKNDDPFDVRIMVQKNRKGKWVIASILVRTGTGQKVVSNTYHGGGISYPKPFLKSNFDEAWKDIYSNLKELATTLPYKIEEIKNNPMMDIGLDIGICNQTRKLYLFEANDGASVKRFVAESATLRVEYYQYLIETNKKLNKAFVNSSEERNRTIDLLEKENKKLLQEVDSYKIELNKLYKSKSWRYTYLLRKIGSLFKR